MEGEQENQKNQIEAGFAVIDRAMLTPLVREALGRQRVEVLEWRIEPLAYHLMAATSGGVYRVRGLATDRGEQVPWTLVLKVIRSPEHIDLEHRMPWARGDKSFLEEPSSPMYWKREILANESGLLKDLPGQLRPVRCYTVMEPEAGIYWLWFEELHDIYDSKWPLERYRLAARHIGSFNGAYLTGTPLPDYPWFNRGMLQRRMRRMSDQMRADIESPEYWNHPLVREVYPVPVAERILKIFDNREALLAELERQPNTLCHYDIFLSNMFACHDDAGNDQTVLIDWAFMGMGHTGEDLLTMLWGNLLHNFVSMADMERYEQLLFEGYNAGLRDAGFQGNLAEVRFVYCASAALQFGMNAAGMRFLLDENRRAEWRGRTVGAHMKQMAGFTYHALDLADEAIGLLA